MNDAAPPGQNGPDDPELARLREAIDAVDDEILSLIRRRARLAARVGERKRGRADAPFYVPSREARIIRRLLARNAAQADDEHESRIPEEAVHGIYREIIGACLALEHPLTIAFLGPEGTFSHTAATRQFGATAEYLSCASLDQVFDEVEAGRATYGVVPVENAFEGAVTHTLDLFADVDRDVWICAEVQLSIHHHLFSHASSLAEIETVLSHPQPLAQCRAWLAAHLPDAARIETSSTMRAGEMIEQARRGEVSSLDWKRAAAIGPYAMVDRFSIPLLARNIEDHRANRTRFFVIGAHDSPPSGRDRTSLVMSVKDEPGALHNLIRPFAERGIGLTRIESRPSKRRLWEYVFFADVDGHRDEAAVAAAIEEISAMPGAHIKVLGSYPVSEPL
ncbi:MAG: prephenate dehydratase [Mariprofundaceae bacterium]